MRYSILQKADFFSSEGTKIVCRRAPPGPVGGAYSAHPDPLAAFEGLTSERREERGGEERGERGRKGGRKGEGDATHPL